MKKFLPAYIRVPVFFFIAFAAMEYFIDSGNRPAFVKYPIVMLLLLVILVVLIAFEIVVAALDNIGFRTMTPEQKELYLAEQALPLREKQWYKKLMKSLTRAEALENENALLLQHDYDGIRELDNDLPPWWKYLFIGTILFGGFYLFRFEIMGGDNQEMEYAKEVAEAKAAVELYKKTAPDLMDEKSVTLLTKPADLAIGKNIFMTNCVACHRADAGGQIGPNLTDDYWLLGGGIKNVFHTVTNGGRDGKGMVAWRGTLKPTEIQHVASYVLSLRGSNPKNPKAPDGEIWVDDASKKAIVTAPVK